MGIKDNQLLFSDSQDIDASALSTNVIDLGALGWNAAKGFSQDLEVWLNVDEAFVDDSGTDGTITVSVRTDADADLSSGHRTIVTGEAIPVTSLTLNADLSLYSLKLPAASLERYVGLYYTVASMSPSAGELSAGLTVCGSVANS